MPPVRVPGGVKYERMRLILAVLTKHAGLKLFGQDVHLNVTGGLQLEEPAADLAIALAVAASYRDTAVPRGAVAIGELGLGGELRPVPHAERRLAEAAKRGFTHAVAPAGSLPPGKPPPRGMHVVQCRTVAEAVDAVLGPVR